MKMKQIVANDVYSFSLQLQESILEGYRIDNSNENVPQMIGFVFVATLVMKDEIKSEEVVEDKAPKVCRAKNAK